MSLLRPQVHVALSSSRLSVTAVPGTYHSTCSLVGPVVHTLSVQLLAAAPLHTPRTTKEYLTGSAIVEGTVITSIARHPLRKGLLYAATNGSPPSTMMRKRGLMYPSTRWLDTLLYSMPYVATTCEAIAGVSTSISKHYRRKYLREPAQTHKDSKLAGDPRGHNASTSNDALSLEDSSAY